MDPLELDLDHVTFTYEDGVQALINLSLKACPGEFVVILGANGAGKSTLCFLLSGIVPHIYGGNRNGKVSVAGRDPWDDPLYVTAQSCGVLLQDPEVQLFNPTVSTELAFGPSNLKAPRQEILDRIGETLALLRLEGLEKRNPRDLSGGQKQRVALGAVLTMRPRVLILDEPTSQLDPVGRWEVVEAIHQLKSTGKMTIVMTTHETDDILDLADQVLVLDKGRVVVSGKPAEVFSKTEILREVGVKIPDALDILDKIQRVAGEPISLTDEQVRRIDAGFVGQVTARLVDSGKLEIAGQETTPGAAQGAAQSAAQRAILPPAGPPILEADRVTFRYPGYPPVTALQEVSVAIRPGELVGIVGQNGSGKSTLVKCFVGLLRPAAGEIRVSGADIRKTPVGEMARKVGLVLQNPDYQLFTISSREEILFGLKNIGIEGKEAGDIVREVLGWVGLEDQVETFPFRMSFGDRRKLAVAATVALDPQVLILDEPTTAQDHRGRYQLAEIGRRFRDEKGRTILMITHDMDLIARYAERLIVMWNGRILLDGPTAEVFAKKEDLARSFLRPPVAAEVARSLAPLGFPPAVITPEDLVRVLRSKRRNIV
jgi:energy-coupling factor transport system ATP-binding protein